MRVLFLRRRLAFKLVVIGGIAFLTLFFFYQFSNSGGKKKNTRFLPVDKEINPEQNVVPKPPSLDNKNEVPVEDDQEENKREGGREAAVFKKGVIGNFEPKEPPKSFKPGEDGKAVHTSMEEKAKADQTVREFGFNMVASDKIAMNRSIPDTRMEECKYWHYPEDLPTASVILVFYNEGWSTLLRTVHSVINTSPPHLLHEVVLVDDDSDKDMLKEPLDDYVKQWNGKVKVFRNKERMGLIQARNRGAELSTGDVIIFLDAHCECNRNWLVPLLARIHYDRTILAVPIVDGINWDNMAYYSVYDSRHHRGIFEWGFLYKESIVPEKELATREHASEPYKSPTHAGGLFAMDRKYFWEMGGYDPGLQIWGGENYELAFKVWMCGGSSEWVPCSRVGHIYRGPRVAGLGRVNANPKLSFSLVNYMRVVEVWMDDEHKEYFYTREPVGRGAPIGDISKQLQFKKDHNCKSFKWFMDNVAYEVYDKFPKLPPNKAWGEVKEKEGENRCWDTLGQGVGGGPIGVFFCHGGGGNQLYRINMEGQIGLGERCLDSTNGDTIHIKYCDVQPNGPWDFDERKSAKSKEKKQRKKEESAKYALSVKKVADANAVEDPLAPFSAFRKYDRNGICVTFETKRVDDLDRDTVEWAFQLTKSNMQTVYEESELGWKDRDKREEMTDSRAWYLVGREQEGRPVAFIHFRFDMEGEEEILYCYEIQLIKEVRRKGLGKFMMQILELMAHRYGMLKVMLTTFKHNPEGHNFFTKKLKYDIDDTSPEASVYEDDISYIILSKTIPQKTVPAPSTPRSLTESSAVQTTIST